jgi:F-type H+-transporting ATPase subunit c
MTNLLHILDFLAQGETATGGLSKDAAKLIGAGLAMGLGAIGPGIGLGIGTMGATQAIGRNPEAEGPVRTAMILGLGFAEAVAIYALVVALVIFFIG